VGPSMSQQMEVSLNLLNFLSKWLGTNTFSSSLFFILFQLLTYLITNRIRDTLFLTLSLNLSSWILQPIQNQPGEQLFPRIQQGPTLSDLWKMLTTSTFKLILKGLKDSLA